MLLFPLPLTLFFVFDVYRPNVPKEARAKVIQEMQNLFEQQGIKYFLGCTRSGDDTGGCKDKVAVVYGGGADARMDADDNMVKKERIPLYRTSDFDGAD